MKFLTRNVNSYQLIITAAVFLPLGRQNYDHLCTRIYVFNHRNSLSEYWHWLVASRDNKVSDTTDPTETLSVFLPKFIIVSYVTWNHTSPSDIYIYRNVYLCYKIRGIVTGK